MHRLRDLRGRQLALAAILAVALAIPVGVSIARAHHVGWLPSGDDALIGLRTHDVFTPDRPLVGQPSTSHLYGPEQGTAHPGPVEFYWLAVPLRALGPSAGMILGVAVVSLASVWVAAWVVLRRAGPGVAAWAAVLLALLLWAEGTAILTDPISSNAGGIPLVALAVLAWAVADGDVRLLPLGALFGSWVAQQHLAIVVPAAALVALAVVALAVRGVVRWRAGPTEDRPPPWWPWVVGALAVCLVVWAPVLWQQVTGDPGNLTAIVRYARESTAPKLGWLAGLRQAVRALGVPPLLVRPDLRGDDFYGGPLTVAESVVAAVSVAALVAVAVGWWRRCRSLALLAVTALVLAVAGVQNGRAIPDSIEAFRINFYRWAYVVAWLAWIAFGWAAGRLLATWSDRRGQAGRLAVLARPAALVAVVAVLVPTVANATTTSYNDQRRDQDGFGVMRDMADAAVDEADAAGAGRVTLVLRGKSAVLASGSAVALQLEAAGHRVVLPDQEARFWGDQRILEPGDDPGGLVLQLVSGRGDVPDGPGQVVARVDLNARLRRSLDPLVATARGADVVPSDRAEELLAAEFQPGQIDYVRGLLAAVGTDPATVLTDGRLLGLVADGYYASPSFDPDQVARLRAQLPAVTVNDDDVFELRVLTPAELAEVVPAWSEEQP